jgi:hypothetical protein
MVETESANGLLAPQPILNKLEHLGYYLLPRTHAHSPGHSGLLVFLVAGPGPDVAFVPHTLQTRVLDVDHTAHWTRFEATTPVTSVRTVIPGKFILRDRQDQEVEFFVFGGALTAETVSNGSIYSFQSRAPVLMMTRTSHNIATHLAVEVEVLLAEQRAIFYAAEHTFLKRLSQVDPFQLYLTCLQTILDRYEHVEPLRDQYRDFFHMLKMEKAWLIETGQWPQQTTPLQALLELAN